MSDEGEENEIVVVGNRDDDDDDDSGGGGGGFWGFGGWGFGGGGFGGGGGGDGGGGGGGSQPPPDDEPDEEPQIIVEATRPDKGQEDFADDNDVFNDGEAPGANTVLAWLETLYELGAIDSFYLVENDPDDPDAGYRGEYTESDGDKFIFESDGQDNYGRYQQPSPPPPPPSGPQLGYLDEWDWNPGNDPNIDLF